MDKVFKKYDDFRVLKFCLDNYKTDSLFIRKCGSCGGDNLVVINFEKNEWLSFDLIDGINLYKEKENKKTYLFEFPLAFFPKGFCIQYVDETKFNDAVKQPAFSKLRICLDDYYMEIDFVGEIAIEELDEEIVPGYKYHIPVGLNYIEYKNENYIKIPCPKSAKYIVCRDCCFDNNGHEVECECEINSELQDICMVEDIFFKKVEDET